MADAGIKVGGIYYDLTIDDKGFVQAVQRADQSINGLEKKFGSAVKASQMFAVGLGVVAGGVLAGIGAGVKYAGQLENLEIALQTVTGSAEDADRAMKIIKRTAQESPFFETDTLARFVQVMAASGQSIDNAVESGLRFGDVAAAFGKGNAEMTRMGNTLSQVIGKGKADTVDFKELVNAGWVSVRNDVAETMGISMAQFEEMVEAGVIGYDEIYAAAEKYRGSAEAQSNTFTALTNRIKEGFLNLAADFATGQGAFEGMASTFDFVKDAMRGLISILDNAPATIQYIRDNFEQFRPVIYAVVGVMIGALIPAFIALAGAIWAAVAPLLPFIAVGALIAVILGTAIDQTIGWGKAWEYVQMALGIVVQAIIEVGRFIVWVISLISGIVSSVVGFFGYTRDAGTQAYQEVAESAEESADKQTEVAEDSNQKQVQSAGKKQKDIQKLLKKEEDDFALSMRKRKAQFEENIAELVWAHQDKIKSLEEQISDENSDFNERMTERKEAFADAMEDLKESHEDKVKNIEKQIEKEKAKGKKADEERLAELQEQLAEENAEYEKTVLEREEKQKKEDEKLIARHQKQIEDYQNQLKAEQDILNAHQEQVNMVKDKAREDDIARAIRQYEEEKAEAEKAHQQKMIDIVEQNSAQGGAGASALNTPLKAGLEEIKKANKDTFQQMGKDMVEQVSSGAFKAGQELVSNFVNGLKTKVKDLVAQYGEMALSALAGINPIFNVARSMLFPKNARGTDHFGGGWTWVGEQGPELINLPRGSKIYPNEVSKQMSSDNSVNQQINVNVKEINSQMDLDSVGRELGFAVETAPR